MSAKIGRNELCPCGSGKKYKHCCLALDQEDERRRRLESAAVETTLVYLDERSKSAIGEALSGGFFGLYDPAIEDDLDELEEETQDMVWSNAYEWLLAEGTLELDGQSHRVVDLLDDPALVLDPDQREWLRSLSQHPLGFYQVERLEEGVGVWLRDLLDAEKDLLFVPDRHAADMYLLEEVLGLRLLADGEHWRSSFALYPFHDEDVPMVQAAVRAAAAWAGEGEAPSRSDVLIESWFNAFFELVEDEDEDDLEEGEWDDEEEDDEAWDEEAWDEVADNDDEPPAGGGGRGPRAV